MTGNSDKLRSLFLATLMVLSVVAMTTTFAGTALAASGNSEFARTSASGDPVTVYLGEEGIDVSYTGTGSWGPPSTSKTLIGVGGEANGESASFNPDNADISESNGFSPGTYNTNGNDNNPPELVVVEPSVDEIEVYSGDCAGVTSGDTNCGDNATITGSSIPDDGTITIQGKFNFGNAAPAELSVMDESGVDVTNSLNPAVATRSTNERWFYGSGDKIVIDLSAADVDTGDYTIEVSGDDEYPSASGSQSTDFEDASMSTSLTIRDSDTTISLSREEATQGATVTGTVSGNPGEVVTLSVDGNDLGTLSNGNDASPADVVFDDDSALGNGVPRLFKNTEDRIADGVASGSAAAVYDLGDSGTAQFQIQTGALEEDNTATLEVQEGGNAQASAPTSASDFMVGNEDDDVDLQVNEPAIEITEAPSVMVIGEEFDIMGSAPEIDNVAAYVRLDDSYYRIADDVSVDGDDTFEIEDIAADGDYTSGQSQPWSGPNVLGIPGNYRVSVADYDVSSGFEGAGSNTAAHEISDDDFSDIDAKGSFALRTQQGSLDARLDTQAVAYGVSDEVELSGTSVGNVVSGNEEVFVFTLGPRGNTYANSGGSGSISVEDDNNFSEEFSIFERRGTYNFVVVGAGRDGVYGTQDSNDDPSNLISSGTIGGSNTREQNLEIIRDTYEEAGVDDSMVMLSLTAENAQLSVDPLSQSGTVTPGEVTVSGTSNREDETEVFVEVLDSNNEAVTSASAEVDGATGSWETTVDLNGLSPGQYTLRAQDDESTSERDFQLAESTPTATPDEETPTPEDDTPTEEPDTPTEEPDTEEPDTETETSAPDTMAPDTDTDSPTPTTGPGFGVIVGILALLGAGLLATRRRD
jgi:major cell surface glycoprotein (TIGR04216 family)